MAEAEQLRAEAKRAQLQIDLKRLRERRAILENIDAVLLQLYDEKLTVEDVVRTQKQLLRKEMFFRIAELANVEIVSSQRQRLFALYEDLLLEISRVDPALHAEITSEITKELNSELNRYRNAPLSNLPASATPPSSASSSGEEVYDELLQQWMRQMQGDAERNGSANGSLDMNAFTSLNVTDLADLVGARLVRFPPALPLSMVPLMLQGGELNKADVALLLSDEVFGGLFDVASLKKDVSAYLLTLQGTPSDASLSPGDLLVLARQRIDKIPGLSDRVRVLLLPQYDSPVSRGGPLSRRTQIQSNDNKDTSQKMTERYSGSTFTPIFVVLSRAAKPRAPTTLENLGAVLTLTASCATSLLFATDLYAQNPLFVDRALAGDPSTASSVLGVAGGFVLLQLLHDYLGHFLVASAVYKLPLAPLSFYLPSLQTGLFGSYPRFLDYAPSRSALFDIAIAGPVVGFVLSLVCALYGLQQTSLASDTLLATFPQLPSSLLHSSLLLDSLTSTFLAPALSFSSSSSSNALPLHPFAVVGLVGLLVNALNFLPIGRLDGGRVALAVAGRRNFQALSSLALVLQAVSFALRPSEVMLYWALIVVVLLRSPDLPPEDDVTAVSAPPSSALQKHVQRELLTKEGEEEKTVEVESGDTSTDNASRNGDSVHGGESGDPRHSLVRAFRAGALALCLFLTTTAMLPSVSPDTSSPTPVQTTPQRTPSSSFPANIVQSDLDGDLWS